MSPQYPHLEAAALRAAAAARDLPIVQTVFDLTETLGTAVYLVGGTVRDMLLGRETHDLDYAVDGDGLRVARYIADRLGGAYVALDEQRRTGRVVLRRSAGGDGAAVSLDFAAFRGPDLEADLRDRDLTINAMALRRDGSSYVLVDPLRGVADLYQRVLRATSARAFVDDPVRTLRAVRLAVQFDCQIEPQTRRWLVSAVPHLPAVSAERVRDEWFRALAQDRAGDAIEQMADLDLLAEVAPPAAALASIHRPHRGPASNVLSQAVETVRAVEGVVDALQGRADSTVTLPDGVHHVAPLLARRYASPICDQRTYGALLKCAALLHPVALSQVAGQLPAAESEAAATLAADSGRIAAELALAWRCSKAEVDMLRTTVGAHSHAARLARQERVDRRAIYRYYRQSGEHGVDAATLALAIAGQETQASTHTDSWQRTVATTARLWHAFYCEYEQVVNPPPLLSGHDLMQLGMAPGPQMGELLDGLHEEQAAGDIVTRGQALDAARAWMERAQRGAG